MEDRILSDDEISKKIGQLSEILSAIFRSMENKETRIKILESLEVSPASIRALLEIFGKGIENEDYETCEAIKEYMNNLGFDIVEECP